MNDWRLKMRNATIRIGIIVIVLFLVSVQTYAGWTVLDAPEADLTDADDIDGDRIVGIYFDLDGWMHGFLYNGIEWVSLDYSGAWETNASGIDGDRIVGGYLGFDGAIHGFLYDGIEWISLDYPGESDAWLSGIDGDRIVGGYSDFNGEFHGFLYDGINWVSLDYPGASETSVEAIDGDRIVGVYYDSDWVAHGFLYDGINWVSIDYPGASETWVNGIDGNRIVGGFWDPNGDHGFVYDPSRLFVVIPGINYDGEKLIEGARALSNSMCLEKTIAEVDALEDDEIRNQVAVWSQDAKTNVWDLIINIDMDLENYNIEYIWPESINRWIPSTEWAGKMVNIVSEEFAKVLPEGRRLLYAHSAGGDAVYKSLQQCVGKKMYDDINIINGRTGAGGLSTMLGQCGYDWFEVKIFTSQGDFLSLPAFLWFEGSISNKDAVVKKAQEGAWVHLHCNKLWIEDHLSEPIEPGHNTLRDYYDSLAEFEIYTQTIKAHQYDASVIDAIHEDWTSR
jgi:hypothetical protein